MKHPLKIYNSLTRKKEAFRPLNPPFVGMYVCGPTVYGYAHLGHAKSYVSFDVIYRYLKKLRFKVRYVQNITDVGHLTDDADDGEDKIEKQSKVEKLEPMEIVEHYMAAYFKDMDDLNVLRPSISPRPSGHIPEQIDFIRDLIHKGIAYEANGSVYFDVSQYNQAHNYGKLSGRQVEELMEGAAARGLEKQEEKKNPLDFALWKKAGKSHIMKWPSPWGYGYPGWHLECTVMSQKYLGNTFDIHGGGIENMFPHHECEVAQAEARYDRPFANFWIHNNMVTVNGQKMGKSLGNSISVKQLLSGDHSLLKRGFSPMTVRFFILQSHYRSTLDFSNEALNSAAKGFQKLLDAYRNLNTLKPSGESSFDLNSWVNNCYQVMDDDFNTPKLIAELFEATNLINRVREGTDRLSEKDLQSLQENFKMFFEDILGLKAEKDGSQDDKVEKLMDLILTIRQEARKNKDFNTSDKIRDSLKEIGFRIKDSKDGTEWTLEET